jgi:copper chaperone CopZ
MAENITLQVAGMTCTGCEQRLAKALGRVDGVREATADHRTGQVRVRFDPAVTDRVALAAQVHTAGYEVTGDAGAADGAGEPPR